MFQVASITKSFKEKAVLKGVSFSIEEGDKIALLGNNGAGKSTLFNIIAGQLQADSGTIKTSLDFQREIGMMPQGDLLIEDLTVAEFVELKSRMNQLKQADINGLLEMVELRGSKEQMVGSLSGGQKRRLSLLLTILNHPKLIFLDEPTTGMDLDRFCQSSSLNLQRLTKSFTVWCSVLMMTFDFERFSSAVLSLS